MIGHIPYGCGLLEAEKPKAPNADEIWAALSDPELTPLHAPTPDEWIPVPDALKSDVSANRMLAWIAATNNGYDRTRIPDAPAEPRDCARRRGEHFVERMRAHRSACAKERMGYDGRDLVPEMPNK